MTIAPRHAATRSPRLSSTTTFLVLLCVMYAITYIVRVNVSTAASVFKKELHLTNAQVGLVFSAFAYPYLVFQIIGGWIGDRFGARRTLTVSAIIWATATLFTGLVGGLASMLVARVMLGLGEGATFPTATRAMSDWTPAGKRGCARGITHSSARLGNALTPPLIAWLMAVVTWRGSFVLLGIVSLAWAAVWLWYFRDDPGKHRGITPAELEVLPRYALRKQRDPVPWSRLTRRMLPVTAVYFCYAWTLWLYLAWIPMFFLHSYNLDLKTSALFSGGVFFGGVVGEGLGGIVSDSLFCKTNNLNRARRDLVVFGFLCSLAFMVPILFLHNVMWAALCLSVAFFFS